MVGISPFDEPGTATIAYIGVLPSIAARATSTTCSPQPPPRRKAPGFARILSDVDTEQPSDEATAAWS